ncbi:hypothetical protein [Roseomonas sp. KE0001]|uniref:hypothetical protein n=1 Tax=Roseomonas sp. KE0001 TaxID=2479201 RepID=UPI0018DEF42B|nr:hypothetical protein [Roseomonas sp. KE0001]
MIDGGWRGDPKYRSATRHRAATPRKDTQAKWNGRKAITAQRSGMADKLQRDEHEKALALWSAMGKEAFEFERHRIAEDA